MEEKDAILLLKQGDLSGLEYLIRRYQVRAIRTAFLIVGNVQSAEDIVQDTFVNLVKNIHHYDNKRPFAPWFFRSVMNSAIKTVQKEAKWLTFESEMIEPGFRSLIDEGTPEDIVVKSEFRNKVWDAMQQLTPRQRAVIVQRYFLEMSEKEMAGKLQTTQGTVKWHLFSARQRLRSIFMREEDHL